MSTRSCIAIEHPNGEVSSIYCHGDGYLSGVGLTLYTSYQSYSTVKAIINLGDLSYLGDVIDMPSTCAYARDRTETGTDARQHGTVDIFFSDINNTRQDWGYEYCYLLTKSKGWIVKQYDQPWEPLHIALVTEKLLDE
jgi:hypothetical protein